MFENGISELDFYPRLIHTGKVIRTGGYEVHTHNFMEITYVVSGEGEYILGDKKFTIITGDLILVNPGIPHASIVTSDESTLVLFTICFDGFQLVNMEENHIILPEEQNIIHTEGSFQTTIEFCINNIWLERNRRDFGRSYMIRNYLSMLIISLLRFVYDEPEDLSNEEKPILSCANRSYMIDYVRRYIDTNYWKEITLDTLAKEVNLSAVYLSKLFKESTGMTPIHYLIQIRLAIARSILMKNPWMNVGEVAKKVGYHDLCHFSKMFKKKFGVSPGFYKK